VSVGAEDGVAGRWSWGGVWGTFWGSRAGKVVLMA